MSSVILAVASPPGRSPRGIIRISGRDSFALLHDHLWLIPEAASEEIIARKAMIDEDAGQRATMPPPGLHRARLNLGNHHTLPALALVFHAPHSYTGEHAIELQLPGNPHLLDRVIAFLLDAAKARNLEARRAEPGEFTARAFFNGKLSLTQAEGVAATIAAVSDAELRAAQMLRSGALGRFAHGLADDLATALALVEAGIDFTDQEDVVAITPGDLFQRLSNLRGRIDDQLRRATGMEQLQAIPWVVLHGEPNAGKSALFNALLGHERAVVSPTAGTTRDVLAEPLAIPTSHGPAEVMLIDLAGIDVDDQSTINRLMQDAGEFAARRAELILRCVPALEKVSDAFFGANEMLVRTKSDLVREAPAPDGLSVSSITGQGLDALRRAIAARLADRAVSLAADATALGARHEAALRSALNNLDEGIDLVAANQNSRSLPHPELIASSMRAALDDLAALAGDITPDDILGRVFTTFCVGK